MLAVARFFRRFVIFLGCSLVLAYSSQAREITCYSDVFAPYVTLDRGEIRGIDVDTVAEAGRRVGIMVNFQLLPWVRLERELSLGASSEVECAFAYTSTAPRRSYMDFTTVPLKQTELSFFVRRGTLEAYTGMEGFKGKTVGIRRGFKLPSAMQALVDDGSIRVEESNGDIAKFEKLARGRLHAILSNREVGFEALEKIGKSQIVSLSPSVEVTPTYLVFNKAKDLSALVPLFDKGMKSVVADGTYRRIRSRYVETSSRP